MDMVLFSPAAFFLTDEDDERELRRACEEGVGDDWESARRLLARDTGRDDGWSSLAALLEFCLDVMLLSAQCIRVLHYCDLSLTIVFTV